MNMTKEINELIEVIKNIQFGKIQPLPNTATFWASTTQALTEYRDSLDRFDVLQHLLDGGSACVDGWPKDEFIAYNGKDIVDENGKKQDVTVLLDNICELKSYTPPVEDMLEDGFWYWCNVSGHENNTPLYWNKGWNWFNEDGQDVLPKYDVKPILRDGKPIKVEVPE